MKKKCYMFLGAVLLLLVSGAILWFLQSDRTVAASTISQTEADRLMKSVNFSEDFSFELFCNQETVPYDAASDTYYLPQTSDGSWIREDCFTLADERMKLYWYEDESWKDLASAIAEGHAFSFLVTDGVSAKEGKIVFTGLPMIKIDRLKETAENTFYCKVTVYDPFHNDQGLYEIISCYGNLSQRGKTSQMFPKKGWNLELIKENGTPYKTSLLGLRTDDDWKLNALYPDASKVREQVAMNLWNELAEQTESPYDAGTRMEYFELMLDSDYHGIYGAMEQLDYKQFSLDKTEDVIYKSYAWPREGHIDENALDGEDNYCGHLIKAGDREITADLWQPLVEYVEAAGFKTEDLSFDQDILYDYIKKHMDLENLLNSDLFVQMLYAYDNKYKNLYIAADFSENEEYTLWRVPWDLNYSFGDRYSAEGNALTQYDLSWATEVMPEFMISEMLLEAGNLEFTEALNKKWEELSEGTFSLENVQKLAEEHMEHLTSSGAFARDEKRWPDGPHDTSVEPILEFHGIRLNTLNEHYTSYLNETE